jgi:phospholipase C
MKLGRLLPPLVSALAVAGCNGSIGSSPAMGPSAPPTSNSIQHIVILVQENRSFDNLFAGYPGANTTMEGACEPAPWCKGSHMIHLHQVTLESSANPPYPGKDIDHSHRGFKVECHLDSADVCQMDGFDLIHYGESGGQGVARVYPYAYVKRSETKPYWDLAQQYTLADEMFFTETASSFIAHQMLISGTVRVSDRASVTDQPQETPWGCDSVVGDNAPLLFRNGYEHFDAIFPCFKWATMADLLDAKKVPWLFYVDPCCQKKPFDFSGGAWNGYRAIHKIFYGPDYKTDISSPNTNIFADVKGGTLPALSWVIPSLYDSDHPASACNGGPLWVTKVVNAIGTSQYWKNTAVVLIWDDWGGWYDNAPPEQINYTSLGFRVPMIVVSPYAKPNYVSHTHYDFGSILKFAEHTFGLGSLGTTDATAPSMEGVFDFTQTPNAFKAAPLPHVMPCAHIVTNPKHGADGMKELIEHDGGPPG